MEMVYKQEPRAYFFSDQTRRGVDAVVFYLWASSKKNQASAPAPRGYVTNKS